MTIHLQKRLTLLIFIGPKVETSSEYIMVYFMVIVITFSAFIYTRIVPVDIRFL